jgi:hypothetical protein
MVLTGRFAYGQSLTVTEGVRATLSVRGYRGGGKQKHEAGDQQAEAKRGRAHGSPSHSEFRCRARVRGVGFARGHFGCVSNLLTRGHGGEFHA